jgi:hypothetical protein
MEKFMSPSQEVAFCLGMIPVAWHEGCTLPGRRQSDKVLTGCRSSLKRRSVSSVTAVLKTRSSVINQQGGENNNE